MKRVIRFLKDEEGVTAIEYGLIAAATAVVLIAGTAIIGPKLDKIFQDIGNALPVVQ